MLRTSLPIKWRWIDLFMVWERQEFEGKSPDMPAKGYKWNQLGELARVFYDRCSDKSLLQLRAEFKESHHNLVQWVESLTEADLFEPHRRKWTGAKWAIAKWVQVNSIAPYRSARPKVGSWQKDERIHMQTASVPTRHKGN